MINVTLLRVVIFVFCSSFFTTATSLPHSNKYRYKSIFENKNIDKRLIYQSTNFSCGAASLVMYLNIVHGFKINEKDIFNTLKIDGSISLSALEIKRAANNFGISLKVAAVDVAYLKYRATKGILLLKSLNDKSDEMIEEQAAVIDHYVFFDGFDGVAFTLLDPAYGKLVLKEKDLAEKFINTYFFSDKGIFLYE